MDYLDLLEKYMRHVCNMQGTSFVDDMFDEQSPPEYLTRAEYLELRRILKEL